MMFLALDVTLTATGGGSAEGAAGYAAEAVRESAETAGSSTIVSLFWVALAAVIAPLLARLVRGYVPSVVFLLVLGMLIGPYVAGLAVESGGLNLIDELGLGMLFLLAGYELDPDLLRGRIGRIASGAWGASLVLGIGLIALAAWLWTDADPNITSILAVGIAMSSTTLGTLLPIVKQSGLLEKPLGRSIMAHGAMGELGPVLAISLLLTGRNLWGAVAVLAVFFLAAVILAVVPQHVARRLPAVQRTLDALRGGTEQLPVRVVILLLVVLMAVASVFDLDVVLGAFAAGIILRRIIGAARPDIDEPLEAIGYGMLIPMFFVISGMGIDPGVIADDPALWVLFILVILIARGGSVWTSERLFTHDTSVGTGTERAQLALYSAAGLPIIVAVTAVATETGLLRADYGTVMVAAGAATVLLFPLAAKLIGGRNAVSTADGPR